MAKSGELYRGSGGIDNLDGGGVCASNHHFRHPDANVQWTLMICAANNQHPATAA
jgi:hypothetical protein